MKSKQTYKEKGFTLIETLVAIFILVFAVTGPIVFVAQSLQNTYYARDQVTAFFLTQEAVELVKNIRDNNALDTSCGSSSSWLTCIGSDGVDLSACIDGYAGSGADGCVVGLHHSNGGVYVEACSNDNDADCRLKEAISDTQDLQFSYDGPAASWQDSRFQKRVSISVLNDAIYNGGSEAEVEVRITWKSSIIDREFVVRQNITNWIPIEPIEVI